MGRMPPAQGAEAVDRHRGRGARSGVDERGGLVRVGPRNGRRCRASGLIPRRHAHARDEARRARAHRRTDRSRARAAGAATAAEGGPLMTSGSTSSARSCSWCSCSWRARSGSSRSTSASWCSGWDDCWRRRDPASSCLIPFVDRGIKVDLREFYLEIPRQDSITKDNAAISIDFIMYYKVLDPSVCVIKVSNFAGAATNIAATTLRAVVGDISLDDVLAKRDEINAILRVEARRGDRALGREGDERRDPRDHPPAVGPGGDDAPDVGRADAARGGHRGRGREAGRDHGLRGQQGGRDLERRGPEAVRDPEGRG